MANGWGGRRAGAGAPKGNNNAVQHGEYCRLCVDVDTFNSLELRILMAAVCREIFELPDLLKGTPDEQREWFRLVGITSWIVGKLIQVERKKSRDLVKQALANRKIAKTQYSIAKAELIAAKARLMEAKTKK